MHVGDKIFKRDRTGNVRVWWAEAKEEADGTAWHRRCSGVKDGSVVISGWKEVFPKNTGRSNATTAFEQALSEIESLYTGRLDRGYFRDEADIDSFTKFIPMLAGKYTPAKIDYDVRDGVWAQPKLDGIRCNIRADGMWSRAGKPIVSCPHIWEAVAHHFEKHPDDVLDGELYNHDLKDDFNKITSLVRRTKPSEDDIAECANMVQYHIYDVDSDEVESFPHRLYTASDLANDFVKIVETVLVKDQDHLDKLYAEWLELGYEGEMVRLPGEYEHKRSKLLQKRKEFISNEFPVARVEEGVGNWAGAVKRFIVEFEPGRTCGAGVRGSREKLTELWESGKTPDWCTLRYFTPTPDGVPRFPVVVDWGWGERED